METISEIKKLLGSEKMIIGAGETLKALRAGTLAKVFLAKNTKVETRQDIERYAGIAAVEVVQVDVPNDELGTLCKKPFPISVIGVRQ
jgi:large subunit ribosomal protein L30e